MGNDNLKLRTYKFSITVIKCCSDLPNSKIYQIIIDQLVRASTSIGANIIEAQAASSKRDFIRFFEIALKSSNETLYWLGLLRDAVKSDEVTINLLITEAKEISKMLGASVLTMKNKR